MSEPQTLGSASSHSGNGDRPKQPDARYIGIDLGTTYCAMAWLDSHGHPVTLPNSEDEPTTPSVVLFEPSGEVIVGREAKRAALVVPELVADHVKRDMGLPQYHKRLNYRYYSPSSISALILKKLKQDAEKRIGPIAGAVITVPAYFDEKRRRATAAAGEIAGLKVIDILNEPTSAALAYAFRDFVSNGGQATDPTMMAIGTTANHVAVVYDLGGGTFDVTVLRIAGDDLTVLATDGDSELGGRDWDQRIVDWVCYQFQQKFGGDPRDDPHSLQALVLSAEEAKKDLSRLPKTRLLVVHGGRSLKLELQREDFERMTADLLDRSRRRVAQVIEQAGLNWGQVHEVLAVGGSSRMPMVLQMLKEVTGKTPNCSLPPSEAVAHGAAIHAAIKAFELWQQRQTAESNHEYPPPPSPDSDPFALIEDEPSEVPMDANAPAADEWEDEELAEGEPDEATREELLQTALSGEVIDLQIDADPAGQFDSDVQQTLRRVHKTDVNAHTLGVVVTRDQNELGKSILIPRNTPLPASATKIYGTLKDNQPEVVIRIIEGEPAEVDDCAVLGACRITDLPAGLPRGSPVEVTFTLDGSGRLHVQAVETTSGQSVTTAIHCDAGIAPDKIHRAREAMRHISVI
jgi:molecular chaperone DnaK (HSP70)